MNASLRLACMAASVLLAADASAADASATSAACPYSVAELRAALGLDIATAKAAPETPIPGGKMLSCRYDNTNVTRPGFFLKQTVMANPNDPSIPMLFRMNAGRMDAIAGDPDGAQWQSSQGDLSEVALHYLRKGSIVEARVNLPPRDPAYADMRARVQKLRRLP